MTRINVGVDPCELPDKLLLAEHREITRIPNAVTSGKAKSSPVDEFKLGPGHVRFFYNKLAYLANRYAKLHSECVKRGFDVTDKSSAFIHASGDYVEQPRDRQLVIDRIESRGFRLLTKGEQE